MTKTDYDVCIVGLKCFDLLSDKPIPEYLGGIEKQLVSLAGSIKKEGYRVAFITYDHGQKAHVEKNGISIYKSYDKHKGVPLVRFFFPRMVRLWLAMKRANAKIYIQMGGGSETGNVAMGCRHIFKEKRAFIFLTASNGDCEADLPLLRNLREKKLYRYGLRSADLVIAQTVSQQNKIEKDFKIKSQVIPLPCSWANRNEPISRKIEHKKSSNVLWVGRIDRVKRIEWLFETAIQCPDITFHVVGAANSNSEYTRSTLEAAKGIQNVIIHGKVSDQKLADLYRISKVLCCTSIIEGFPTTFLEAWSYGLPVVTTFDPDNIVSANGLGKFVRDLKQLQNEIYHYIRDANGEWEVTSKIVLDFVNKRYSIQATTKRILSVLSPFL
jgi:glycosyltransferase involved in cell wall biosynthesis